MPDAGNSNTERNDGEYLDTSSPSDMETVAHFVHSWEERSGLGTYLRAVGLRRRGVCVLRLCGQCGGSQVREQGCAR
jgi:hypothetical protein